MKKSWEIRTQSPLEPIIRVPSIEEEKNRGQRKITAREGHWKEPNKN
jgi:hypothetical protein